MIVHPNRFTKLNTALILQTLSAGRGAPLPVPLEWWKCNEGSGTTLATQSGSGDTISLSNVTWSNPGSAFPFLVPTLTSAASSYGIGANATNTNFTGTTPFSVSVWLYPTTLSGTSFPLSTLSGGGPTGWELQLSSGVIGVVLLVSYPTNGIDVNGSVSLTANALNHAVFTYDGSQNGAGVKIYLNGVLQTSTVVQSNLTSSIANGQPISFGTRQGLQGTYTFPGSMADVRIFGTALNQTQVTKLFAGGVN
jgi:hypothetical protein